MRGCERRRRPGSDGGFVTAEAALALPLLLAFAMALVCALLAVVTRIQCVDAARTGARAAARQDPADRVVELTRAAAPRGARVTVGREGDRVRVVVVAPPPMLRKLPFGTYEVREEAVALAEETLGGVPGAVRPDADTGDTGDTGGTGDMGDAGDTGDTRDAGEEP